MGINDPSFEYASCNFSKAQMKAKVFTNNKDKFVFSIKKLKFLMFSVFLTKDKADEMSKEGCGRVYAY